MKFGLTHVSTFFSIQDFKKKTTMLET